MKLDWINIPQIEEETHEEIGSDRIYVRVDVCEFSGAPFFTITDYYLDGQRFGYGRGPIDQTIERRANKYWTEERLAELINEDDDFSSYRERARLSASAMSFRLTTS